MSLNVIPVLSAWCLLAGTATAAATFQTGKGTEDGFRVSVRVRTDQPLGDDPARFSRLVVVVWKYEARPDGTPRRKSDFDAILTWERQLDELLVDGGTGFHFFTRAGHGDVHSLFHVADVDELRRLSAQAGATGNGDTVTHTVLHDPEWQFWKRERGGNGATE